jgi:hypothetical protein
MASHLTDSFRNVCRPLAVAAAVTVALACVTGPKDSLSGDWSGGGFLLSLHESGSTVTGMAGGTACFGTPVSGSIHRDDFQLTIDTGAWANTYAGSFVGASTISMNQTPAPVDVAIAPILLFKVPATALGKCVVDSRE